MTPQSQPLPASALPVGPARIRAAGALNLLTWPALEASGADAVANDDSANELRTKEPLREGGAQRGRRFRRGEEAG